MKTPEIKNKSLHARTHTAPSLGAIVYDAFIVNFTIIARI